jgi:hypothetical protein
MYDLIEKLFFVEFSEEMHCWIKSEQSKISSLAWGRKEKKNNRHAVHTQTVADAKPSNAHCKDCRDLLSRRVKIM